MSFKISSNLWMKRLAGKSKGTGWKGCATRECDKDRNGDTLTFEKVERFYTANER